MKDHRFDKYLYTGITAVLVIMAAALFIFMCMERNAIFELLGKILAVLAPIIYGTVLAFLLSPVYNVSSRATETFLKDAVKMKSEKTVRGVSKLTGTLLSILFLALVVISLAMMIIPQLYSSIVGIINMMPVYFQNIYNWLTDLFANNPEIENTVLSIYQQVAQTFQAWVSENMIPNLQSFENIQNIEKIVGGVSNGVINVVTAAKNIFIGLIVMIYLLNIKELLSAQAKKIVYAFLPLSVANATVEEFRYIHKVFSGFIIGKLIDSLIIGLLCFIFMQLFKMPFVMLISVIIGVTNIIPFFGPFIGAVPSAILVFLISPKQCLYFILLIILLQQFDGNILGPKILGNSTGLSSFWVLFSILLFGGLFGFAGMILAVPVTAVIFDLLSKLQYHHLMKKHLSPDTRDYMDLKKISEENGSYINRK